MGELINMAEKKNHAPQSKKNDAERMKQLTKLVASHRELLAKMFVISEEIELLLKGKVTIHAQAIDALNYFDAVWFERYHAPYVHRIDTELPQLKRFIRETHDVEIVKRRMFNYIRNDDAYYAERRHPFGLFVTSFNSHTDEAAHTLDLGDAVADCRHTPRCRTDAQHTNRKRNELRAS